MTTDLWLPMELEDLQKAFPTLLAQALPDLMKPITEALTQDINKFVTDTVAPLQVQVKTLVDSAPKVEPPTPPDDKGADPNPLEARLALLETQLAEKVAQEKETAFTQNLQKSLNGYNLVDRTAIQDYLASTLRPQVDLKDDRWLATSGKDLSELVKDFFATDFGKHNLRSQHKEGSGTPQPDPAPKGGKDTKGSLDDIVNAFR